MISGFGGGTRVTYVNRNPSHALSGLPVPFNIPNVLHNLIFEDIGIEFTPMQKDMLETLRFSYNALIKLQASHTQKEKELREKILKESDNIALKEEQEEMKLDMLQATHQFKDIVAAMADLLKREQYEQLLKFSNIPT
jgi:hypothetical protein